MQESWAKKFKIMSLALIFSGALNVSLVAAFIVTKTTSSESSARIARKGAQESKLTNLSLLDSMSKLSFRELVTLLTNREMVEEGYAKRDLAISALTAFHHFNLEKALSSQSLQKRVVSLKNNGPVELYPGLTDEQFEAVIRFAYQDKWPLTSKGLFALVKKLPVPRDESLEQAFFITPEFFALQTLFKKTDAPQDPSFLLKLASEGTWEMLDRFSKEQAQTLDFSVDKRRELLLSYFKENSKTAVQLLIATDLPLTLKKLDDQEILEVLTALEYKSDQAEKFCIALLQSPRSDAVWMAAVEKLYYFAGEPMPEIFDLHTAAARFAPTQVAKEEVKPVAKVQTIRQHTVTEGESLWKIARLYKAKVDDIVTLNGIDKDRLYPGMVLNIPN